MAKIFILILFFLYCKFSKTWINLTLKFIQNGQNAEQFVISSSDFPNQEPFFVSLSTYQSFYLDFSEPDFVKLTNKTENFCEFISINTSINAEKSINSSNIFDIFYSGDYIYNLDKYGFFQTFSTKETQNNTNSLKLIDEIQIFSAFYEISFIKLLKDPLKNYFYLIINNELNIIYPFPNYNETTYERTSEFDLRSLTNINSVIYINDCFIFLIQNRYIDMYCNGSDINFSIIENTILNSSVIYVEEEFNFTDIFIDNNILYIADYVIGIIIFDLTNTSNPTILSTNLTKGIISIKKVESSWMLIREINNEFFFEDYSINLYNFLVNQIYSLNANSNGVKGFTVSQDFAIILIDKNSFLYKHSIPNEFNNKLIPLEVQFNDLYQINDLSTNYFIGAFAGTLQFFRISSEGVVFACTYPNNAQLFYYLNLDFYSTHCKQKSNNRFEI